MEVSVPSGASPVSTAASVPSGASSVSDRDASSCSSVSSCQLTGLMSILYPVRRAARRAFCPSRPIARESWSSGTRTRHALLSPISSTSITSAGASAAAMNSLGSSLYWMMSIFSPRSSSTTWLTRPPRGPTHAPMASTSSLLDETAIFVRLPGSRAMERTSTMPS